LVGLSGHACSDTGGSNHAWAVASSPAAAPQITVLVLIVRGGDGERSAAPLAQEVLDRGLGPGLEPNSTITDRSVQRAI